VWDAWKDVTAATSSPASLVLAGDSELAARVGEYFAPVGGQGPAWTRPLAEISRIALGEGDVLVVLAQPADEDEAVDAIRRARAKPAVIAVDEGPAASHEVTWYSKELFRVSFSEAPDGWKALTGALLDAAGDRQVRLARHYPALRGEAGHRLIRHNARENAVIGAAFFIPGTDMPLMTANQIRMVLSLAVMYGEELTQDRAIEIVSVIGAGFGLRAVARQFTSFVPGPGWALKTGIAYGGTLAMGEAAIRYFEEGAPGTPSRLLEVAEKVRDGVAKPGIERLKGAARRARDRVDSEGAAERVGALTKRFKQ
jgi:uncharacterized protein (DUF697 family)